MSSPVPPPAGPSPLRPPALRRALLVWLIGFGVLLLIATGAVAIANATVLGAGAFVRVYLDALARGDVTGALSLPGVSTEGMNAALLRDGTPAGLRDIHQLSDEKRGGNHIVTVGWTTSEGTGSTAFEVKRVGTRFGLFPEWAFAISPVATVTLNVEHDARFTLNGHQEVSAKRDGLAANYAVLVPGAYVFGHQSTYLAADPDVVLADTVGANIGAVVDVEANTTFVATVSKLVTTQLAACAKQAVLFPTGCSFGQSIDNRVSSNPAWSIVREPRIGIVPGEQFGTWAIPPSPGTAHLTVGVTSLYDGSTSTFDQDVPFEVEADIQLGADDSITVTQR